ncbi:MAG: pyruvate:ferredoxin (flavodoxin) oxidoreductase [bacterium]|nr:pyruvate:ferredoxin (flavodoxin) oxidoreductase [bacterium]
MSKNTSQATIDGNTAAAHVAYTMSEIAAIYPITPSSVIGELVDSWAAHQRKNMFGQTLEVVEMQSEGGAAGAIHGCLSAGSMATTFTASQGLLLMIPNMYKIAGEMLPTVFYVCARSLACQSLSIFGDHSDVMAAKNTGFAMLSASSVQECMDLAVVSHLSTLESSIPFVFFLDGFRTSHEIQKIEMIDQEIMKSMLDMKYVEQFRKRALNPENPVAKAGSQNPDIYFQGRETVNTYYNNTPAIVQKYMDRLAQKIGRHYHIVDYFGAPDADKVVISMGSSCETIRETINYLNQRGQKLGLINVRLYRPFPTEALLDALPDTVKKIAVLDRSKDPAAAGEPLYLDVVNALRDRNDITIIGGRYGLSSKEFNPSMVNAVFQHLDGDAFHGFTVGIDDDVTHKSIPISTFLDTEAQDVKRCIFWGLGSDGTVGANKNSIKIIGDQTQMNAQGYFYYDSKKAGGVTISHLRFGDSPIQSSYLITQADFVAVHNANYLKLYDVLEPLRENGTFLLNSQWNNGEVFGRLTRKVQETIIRKKIKFYNINGLKISKSVGLKKRFSTVMQAAFFIISGILDEEHAIRFIKESISHTFEKKGPDIVKMNREAVDMAKESLYHVEYPERVEDIRESAEHPHPIPDDADDFTKNIIEKIMHFKGDDIPVSQMPLDGVMPTGTSKLEKRAIASQVPRWIPDTCIQCNFCSIVCPHAAIRAKQIEPESLCDAPANFTTLKSKGVHPTELQYRIQVYTQDCTGCGVCLDVCPVNQKTEKTGKLSLEWKTVQEEWKAGEIENAAYFDNLPDNVMGGAKESSVKGSQFKKPLFEFSAACAGCGETPYIKLLTQYFGERMIIANATGCSSIYGATFPTTPFSKTKEGRGPAWANSLFEDNAEYGLGMRLAVDANRKQLKWNIQQLLEKGTSPEFTHLLEKNLELWDQTDKEAEEIADQIRLMLPEALETAVNGTRPIIAKIIELKSYFVDKSVWCIGGDGWAYDIGYGGLDHVLASNRNVNVLVLDTEVYSNTGGQASKATPFGSLAKYASNGKRTGKKDLGLISMSYGNIYVASISMGANMAQTAKAMLEAESYKGPSVIIAYSPCIAHGFDMSKMMQHEKQAVESGYWNLYRFNPALKEVGKNPFIYETKDPKTDMMDFLMSEGRYSRLKRQLPEEADNLLGQAMHFTEDRHLHYKDLSSIDHQHDE